MLHWVPSQRSTRVWATPSVLVKKPAAHTSVDETADTPLSTWSLSVMLGLDTTLHKGPHTGVPITIGVAIPGSWGRADAPAGRAAVIAAHASAATLMLIRNAKTNKGE